MRIGFRPNIARSLGYSGPGGIFALPKETAFLVRMTAIGNLLSGMFPSYDIRAAIMNEPAGGEFLFSFGEEFRLLCAEEKTQFFDFDKEGVEVKGDLIIDAISRVFGRGTIVKEVRDPSVGWGLLRNAYQWDVGLEDFCGRLEACASLAAMLAEKLESKYKVIPGLIEVDYLSNVSRTSGPVVTIKYGNQYSALAVKADRVILYNVSLNREAQQLAERINEIMGFKYESRRNSDCVWVRSQGPGPLTAVSIQSWLDKKFSVKLSGYKITGKQVSGSLEHGFTIKIGGVFYARNEDTFRFEFRWFIHPAHHSVQVNWVEPKTRSLIIREILGRLFPGVASFDEITMEKLKEGVNLK